MKWLGTTCIIRNLLLGSRAVTVPRFYKQLIYCLLFTFLPTVVAQLECRNITQDIPEYEQKDSEAKERLLNFCLSVPEANTLFECNPNAFAERIRQDLPLTIDLFDPGMGQEPVTPTPGPNPGPNDGLNNPELVSPVYPGEIIEPVVSLNIIETWYEKVDALNAAVNTWSGSYISIEPGHVILVDDLASIYAFTQLSRELKAAFVVVLATETVNTASGSIQVVKLRDIEYSGAVTSEGAIIMTYFQTLPTHAHLARLTNGIYRTLTDPGMSATNIEHAYRSLWSGYGIPWEHVTVSTTGLMWNTDCSEDDSCVTLEESACVLLGMNCPVATITMSAEFTNLANHYAAGTANPDEVKEQFVDLWTRHLQGPTWELNPAQGLPVAVILTIKDAERLTTTCDDWVVTFPQPFNLFIRTDLEPVDNRTEGVDKLLTSLAIGFEVDP